MQSLSNATNVSLFLVASSCSKS